MASYEYFADFLGEYFTIFIVCIAHTSFFFLYVVISWPSPVLAKLNGTEDNPLGRPITPEESDLIGSLLYIGASIGPWPFLHMGKKYGRKKVWILLLSIVAITFGLLVIGENVELYYICRLLLGIYIGATTSIIPVYLSEIIAPDEVDFLMSFESIFGFTGIFITHALGPFISLKYFNGGIAVVSLIILIFLVLACPETPYYVMQVEGKDEARKILTRLRKKYVEKELEQIEKIVGDEISNSILEIFQTKKYFKAFLIATIPALLQQLCGITLILTYSQLIFSETNLSIPSHICSIIVTGLLEATIFLAPTLSKRFPSKSIMTVSLTGTGLCNLIISLYFFYGKNVPSLNWLPLAGLIFFVIFYNCGLDPITWTILGRTYPKNINFIGTALTASVYFLSIFPMLYSFKKIDITYLFLGSFISCFLGIFYVKFVFPQPEKVITEDEQVQRALI